MGTNSKQYNFLPYKETSKFCIRQKVTNRDEYRALLKKSSYAKLNLPAEPPNTKDWFGEWKSWDDFLRNPKLIPQLAAHIENHYYLFDGRVWHHTAKGFDMLACRKMSNNKYYTEITCLDGKKRNIIIEDQYVTNISEE